ncbi:MAG: hypothetical protein U0641_10005 [Anaerolineae bacterium]
MAVQENFTPEEWKMLLQAPMTVGLAVSASSPSGPIGVSKESYAIAKALAAVKQAGSSNALVQAVAEQLVQDHNAAKPEDIKGKTPAEVVGQAAGLLGQMSQTLSEKGGADAQGFKEWLIGIAAAVAHAAKENTSFGFGGVEVSDAEKAAVAQLAGALGVADPLGGAPAPAVAPAAEAPAAPAPPASAPASDSDVLADLSKG